MTPERAERLCRQFAPPESVVKFVGMTTAGAVECKIDDRHWFGRFVNDTMLDFLEDPGLASLNGEMRKGYFQFARDDEATVLFQVNIEKMPEFWVFENLIYDALSQQRLDEERCTKDERDGPRVAAVRAAITERDMDLAQAITAGFDTLRGME